MSDTKKVAKTAPARSALKHDDAKDQRRAAEHEHRVNVLRSIPGIHIKAIDALTALAKQQAESSHHGNSADLFRAAEHLAFGCLFSSKAVQSAGQKTSESIKAECEGKLAQAEQHWEENQSLDSIYRKAVADAQKAFSEGAYVKALEFARAAEALTHIHLNKAAENRQ